MDKWVQCVGLLSMKLLKTWDTGYKVHCNRSSHGHWASLQPNITTTHKGSGVMETLWLRRITPLASEPTSTTWVR